jgi:hypothetical protein
MRSDQIFPKQPEPQRQEQAKPKIGEGHAAAMFRAGLKELAQILPAFPDGVRPVEESGLAGNATPQIITEQMGHDAWLAERSATLPAKQNERGMER